MLERGRLDLLRSALTRSLSLLTLVLMLLCFGAASDGVRASGDEEFVAGEVVVKLAKASDLPAVAAAYKLNPTPLDQFGSRPIYRLRITDGADVEQRITQLEADPQKRVV